MAGIRSIQKAGGPIRVSIRLRVGDLFFINQTKIKPSLKRCMIE
ncbi:hypothetical protein PO124_02765 [Bacillus licheniformis]|nr:hypothetical protein [Bacillus licheniformis]